MGQAFAGAFGTLHAAGGTEVGPFALRATGQGWLSGAVSIATNEGGVPMAWLREGDLVRTRDRGFAPILRVLRRDPRPGEAAANPALWPVRIEAGALGPEAPQAAITVSPWQRLLISEPEAKLHFGIPEAFVAARRLVGRPGIAQVPPDAEAAQFHLLFEHHEAILADGQWMESLLLDDPAAPALSSLGPLVAEALAKGHARLARPELRDWEANLLAPPSARPSKA
jgi:hypothetical protein